MTQIIHNLQYFSTYIWYVILIFNLVSLKATYLFHYTVHNVTFWSTVHGKNICSSASQSQYVKTRQSFVERTCHQVKNQKK